MHAWQDKAALFVPGVSPPGAGFLVVAATARDLVGSMMGDISGGRSKALVAALLALDVLIAWVWRSWWGPGWAWKDDLLVPCGLALAWSAVGVVFRSRLGVAGGLSLILWGLLGPIAIIGVILVCSALFVMAISAMPLSRCPWRLVLLWLGTASSSVCTRRDA